MVGIIKDKSIRENKQLLAAATGAIWMCAKTNANVKRLDQVIVWEATQDLSWPALAQVGFEAKFCPLIGLFSYII